MPAPPPEPPQVGLFVTCLVDLFRPRVGFASVELLERAGCRVSVPEGQTCCGQPAYNSGDRRDAAALARGTIQVFEDCDYVVVPSGSCAGQIRQYPALFSADDPWQERARSLAGRTYEILSFLVDVMGMAAVEAEFNHRVTYHDSCSGLRHLRIREQPRRLLAGVHGLELTEMGDTEVCCGFGGTFCVKYPEISARMVTDKVARIRETGAEAVLGGDLGCLMNIAGRLRRLQEPVRAYHAVEVLAGVGEAPGIGEEESR